MESPETPDRIPKIHFSSARFPAPGEAYDACWEGCFRSFYDMVECSAEQRAGFRADIECWNLGDALFGCTALDGFRFGRSQRKLHQDDVDHFMVEFVVDMDGGYVAEAAGRRLTIRPGALYVMDFSRPFSGDGGSANAISMLVSRSLMAAAMPLDSLHGLVLEGPRAAIVGDHFRALLRRMPGLPAADAAAVARG
ncbi:MAG: hypothetical protein WA924_01555, partial [Burkholderiaceae bacterium]